VAPHPSLFEACPLAVERLNDLPPILRDDPDIRAVIYADAKETERQEAVLDQLLDEVFPQRATEVGLPLHEVLLRLTIAPPGMSLPKRRVRMTGVGWQDAVTLLLGTNAWSYREHDPADPTSPDPYVLRIAIPFSAGEFDFTRARALIRRVTSAHLELEIVSTAHFVLGSSELGVDSL
jgi:hypothetical protein